MKKRSKKEKSDFYKKFPKKHDGLKAGDEIIFKRISDGTMSIGAIKFFHLQPTECVIVIDLMLGNFQTAILKDVIRDPTPKLLKSLWLKVERAGTRHGIRSQTLKKKRTKKS